MNGPPSEWTLDSVADLARKGRISIDEYHNELVHYGVPDEVAEDMAIELEDEINRDRDR